MTDISYRKLAWEDIDRFIELREMQLQEEGAIATFDLTLSLLNYYDKHFHDGTFISWIALQDKKIIATSGISFIEKPPYYSNASGKIGLLSSMYTLNPYRRLGIAKKLLGLVVNEAKIYGCSAIHITASEAGAHLYQNFGFQRTDKFFYYNLNR